jgi:uncharacterized protein (TIGR03083 family)
MTTSYEWIVDALEETWTATDRLLRPQSPTAYEAPTPCPGWSVRDVLSHLLGFESFLQGEPVPPHEGEWPAYVRNTIGEMNEAFVEAHRHEPGRDVLDQFREVTRLALIRLRGLSTDEWEVVGWSPEGSRPYHRFQETRLLDSWIHLQDIRDALLEPADDHGVGEEVVVNRFEAALPYVVGRAMGAPDGTVVRVTLTGRLGRSVTLEVAGGRASAVASVAGSPTLEITTPVALFWRRVAGRITAEAFLGASATEVYGEQSLARDFSRALAIMI